MGISEKVIIEYRKKMEDDPKEAVNDIQKRIIKELDEKNKNYRLIYDYYWLLGEAFRKKEDYLYAIESYKKSKKYSKKIKDHDKVVRNCRDARINYMISQIYKDMQELDNRKKYKEKTLKILKKSKRIIGKSLEFPSNKSKFKRYLNLVHSYYHVFEDLILIHYENDKMKKIEGRSKKIWKSLMKNKKIHEIFELGFITHILSLISIIQKNEEKFWEWNSQNFVISIICESIIEDSFFKKYFRELITNRLNLSVNYIKNSYQIKQNLKPKMQNKLIDIILNSDLTKEDYYYLDLLTKLRSENTFKDEDKDKIFELLDEIDQNKKINDLIKVLVQEDVILALLENKEYSEAIEICESNIKLIKNNLKDKFVKQYLHARTLQNQFRIEVKKQNFNQAEKYGNRILYLYKHEKIRRKYDLLLFLIEYGTYYLEQREKYSLIYDKANNLLNDALEIAISKRNKDPEIFGKIFRSFAEINWRDRNYLESLINLFKSECLFLVSNNIKKYSFDGLANLYMKYLKNNGFKIANIDWKTPWI